MTRRRYRGSVSVDIDLDDVMPELSDQDVRSEFEERFGGVGLAVEFDLLAEVRDELAAGRPQYALALVESALNARRTDDDAKHKAYLAAAKVH